MASLRTNYKDDILSGDRKYRMITNSDGTVSFQDVTDYTQEGDTFGALDINATNTAVNALQEANGDTDISGIGDGTNTGAIHTLNTQLTNTRTFLTNNATTRVANSLNVDFNNPFATNNKVGYVDSNSANTPAGVRIGVREVYLISSAIAFVVICGYSTANAYAEWVNVYIDGAWQGWTRSIG